MVRARAGTERGFEADSAESTVRDPGGREGYASLPLTQLVVEGMLLLLRLGWTREERAFSRSVSVDLALDVSYDGSGELSRTVDLNEVSAVVQALSGQEYRLVEDVAETLAGRLLGAFPALVRVRVAVRKPNPPVGAVVAATGAVVIRGRDG